MVRVAGRGWRPAGGLPLAGAMSHWFMSSRKRAVRPDDSPACLVLGIEGGATKTTVLLADDRDRVLAQFELGPGNLKQLSDDELILRLQEAAERLPVGVRSLSAVCAGLAGVRRAADFDAVRAALARVFPRVPAVATNDLYTALVAAPTSGDAAARVLVLSGTGSCCFGETPSGKQARAGGRGHIIGDRGSASDIALRALRELAAWADRAGRWPKLGAMILQSLALNEPDDLIEWSMRADKAEIAGLSVLVFRAAAEGDSLARRILRASATVLAEDAVACAGRLASRDDRIEFVLNGSTLIRNPGFAKQVSAAIRREFPRAKIAPLSRAGVWGAIELARRLLDGNARARRRAVARPDPVSADPLFAPDAIVQSPTEQRNPRSEHLDRMALADAVDLMLDEEESVAGALRRERPSIVRVIRRIGDAFRSGGRLFYAGAGTSGRLGVLDASECPPTFRAPGEQVQGIIAGGRRALWSAVEGAEDDFHAGVRAVRGRGVSRQDVVIGIAASGRTPFVWGALTGASRAGATTVLVCFNPSIRDVLRRSRLPRPGIIIAPSLGPEVLTGSTRLKCGTATKVLLNLFSTLAMARSGKVIGNFMIDLNPSNVKLRDRAVRMVTALTGAAPESAREVLEDKGWIVKDACDFLLRKRGRRTPGSPRSHRP